MTLAARPRRRQMARQTIAHDMTRTSTATWEVWSVWFWCVRRWRHSLKAAQEDSATYTSKRNQSISEKHLHIYSTMWWQNQTSVLLGCISLQLQGSPNMRQRTLKQMQHKEPGASHWVTWSATRWPCHMPHSSHSIHGRHQMTDIEIFEDTKEDWRPRKSTTERLRPYVSVNSLM